MIADACRILNAANWSSKVRPTSLLEQINSCVSYRRKLIDFVYLDVGKLSRLITSVRLSGNNVNEEVMKVCSRSAGCMPNMEMYEMLSKLLAKQEKRTIGTNHISNANIWNRFNGAENILLLFWIGFSCL